MPGYGFGYGYGINQAIWSESDYLIDRFPATAAYSLRKLSDTSTNAVRVRRDSDNAEQDIGFDGNDLDTTALEAFVNSETSTLPADFGSGATAAYSLRYVSDSYTGPVVRVREDGLNAEQDFTPSEITDGTLATFCGANNGFVTTWYDQRSGNDATQATASAQPKIVDAGVLVTENGKPAVSFDGIDDYFDANGVSVTQPNSIAMVAKDPNAGNLVAYDGITNRQVFLRTSATYQVLAITALSISELPPITAVQFLSFATFNSTSSSHYINSTVSTTGDAGTNALTGLRIGASTTPSAYWTENIQELIVWGDSQLSNRTEIEYSINNYYNIYTPPTANGFVTTWYDQAGNNDATQATAGSQPKIYDSSTGVIEENGKPALEFDGVDNFVESPSSTLANVFASTFMLCLVSQADDISSGSTSGQNKRIIHSFDSGNTLQLVINESSADRLGSIAGNVSASNGTFFKLQQTLFVAEMGQDKVFIDGVDSGTGTESAGNPQPIGTGTRIGANKNNNSVNGEYDGTIQEIIIYNSDQSANRTAIESNINSHYNIYS